MRPWLLGSVYGLLLGCSADEGGDVIAPTTPDAGTLDSGTTRDTGALPDRRAPPVDTGTPTTDSATADGPTTDGTPPGDGASGREVCNNGLDDNGNGMVDEGCPCSPGTDQRCYPGPVAEVGVGPCAYGRQGCDGTGEFGTWTECVGAVTAQPEVCGDGIDQDCNGRPDDGPRCRCMPGAMERCYTGPAGTAGRGICREGMRACDPTGTMFGTCLDEVLPRMEICSNRIDDDCDGVVDNGAMCACPPGMTRECYPGPREEIGRGLCRAGRQICNAGGTMWGACTGAVGPMTEVCGNGLDDDCDGSPDDGCPPMRVCNVPVMLDGDCVTTRCPADCPFPVGCMITMAGGDSRGCVASRPDNPVVYFQEGDVCGAGRVTGTLRCSNVRGTGLNATNCPINKPTRYYPMDRSGCPRT
jgi:hypothetical protein